MLVLGAFAGGITNGAEAEAVPTPTIGMVSDLTWGISRADMDRTVSMLSASGVRSVRLNISWSGVERDGKGIINTGWLAEIDAAVSKARAAGIEVLMPIADGVPYWASADPAKSGGSWNTMWRPTSVSDYGDFVEFVVRRYSPLGVSSFEIWNEPNHPYFWPSGVNATAYTDLLRAGSAAVRRANPAAKVVLGGLTASDSAYMTALYAAGAGPMFDIAAIHPYTGGNAPGQCWLDSTGVKSKDAFCGIEAVRDVMVAKGDSAKPLWLTEFGWSSTTATYGVTEALQATYLTEAFAWLATRPYVTNAYWYGFRNTAWLGNDPAGYEANTGLLRTDFTPKPAHLALQALVAARALLAPITLPPITPPPTTAAGYVMVTAAGQVFAFGGGRALGNGGPGTVDIEPTPSGAGYWLVEGGGTVLAFGDAVHRGQVKGGTLGVGERITSLSRTPSGAGYWLFSTRGRVLAFGDAVSRGDALAIPLNGPILDSVPTPSGRGYYMVASDGGIFAFGDARFAGSTGAVALDAPVQSVVPDPDGVGYWLVAADGGVFAFDAGFRGSLGGVRLSRPVTGMVAYGNGYLMVGEDGGTFSFSDLAFAGSLGAAPPASPVVAVASAS